MIPDYRIRFYCLFGALVCLLGSWAIAEQIFYGSPANAVDDCCWQGRRVAGCDHLLPFITGSNRPIADIRRAWFLDDRCYCYKRSRLVAPARLCAK